MKVMLIIVVLALAGCSSPPEPTPVEFGKVNEIVTPSLPYMADFHGVIPSETNGLGWTFSRTFLTREDFTTPEYYYALAHADRVIVYTSKADLWFQVRDGLKAQGARGVIEWVCQSAFLPEQIKITFIKTRQERKND